MLQIISCCLPRKVSPHLHHLLLISYWMYERSHLYVKLVRIRNCVLTSNFPRVANLVNFINLLCPEEVDKCLENDLDMEETLG